jgi:hypothetical protein
MPETKSQRTTRLIELVETQNIASSLRRIRDNASGYDNQRVKRALYHAISMHGNLTNEELAGVRTAMRLP